jgi:monovalent cation:H+ antiporter-2, CPA2 family
MNESSFFQDLAMLMAVAGLVSVVFSRLKWPKVIGYIIAGILLSRHTLGWSVLADEGSVQTVAQLGVVFLMFTLGLEFSASSMAKIRNVVVPVALFDSIIMVWLGYTVGRNVLLWDPVPSLFLGAAICDSSTTLLAKIIDEMKWSHRPFVKYVLGTSVCEDIICVGIIALITGVAQGEGMSFLSLTKSLAGLGVFFVATLVFGLILLPRLLVSVAKRGDSEALLLLVLGCCFFVTYIAFKLDFSLALGAFLVGVIGSNSDVRGRLLRLADPLRSMFAAVFFLSIGLLVDLSACWNHLPTILGLSALVMGGKLLNCTSGALLCGERIKSAVQMGFGLAQIGEFAYLVALLYLTISGDPASPMYQIVVGVSLLTTIMNPLMLRLSEPFGDWAERKCPERLSRVLDAYRATLAKFRAAGGGNGTIGSDIRELVLFAILEFAVAFVCSVSGGYDWSHISEFLDAHKRGIFCLLANVVLLSMFAPVTVVARRLGQSVGRVLVGSAEARWQQAIDGIARLFVMVLVLGLFFLELTMINVNLVPDEEWVQWSLLGAFLFAAVFGGRLSLKAGRRAAVRLSEALSADERIAKSEEIQSFAIPPDAILTLTVGEGSAAVGGTVVTLDVRAKTGVSIVSVARDGRVMGLPGPDFAFRAGDRIGAMGTAEQIAAFRKLLEARL